MDIYSNILSRVRRYQGNEDDIHETRTCAHIQQSSRTCKRSNHVARLCSLRPGEAAHLRGQPLQALLHAVCPITGEQRVEAWHPLPPLLIVVAVAVAVAQGPDDVEVFLLCPRTRSWRNCLPARSTGQPIMPNDCAGIARIHDVWAAVGAWLLRLPGLWPPSASTARIIDSTA